MIIVLRPDANPQQIDQIQQNLQRQKLETRLIQGDERNVIAVIGSVRPDTAEIELYPGVSQVIKVSRPYKLAAREAAAGDAVSRVKVGDVVVGGPQLVVMAGPCSVESRELFLEIAGQVSAAGATIVRGGAFKPRTSPYAFQGMGLEGLQILAESRRLYGAPVVTEVVSPAQVELVAEYADLLQIGARNMQNYELLKAVGATNKPVLLKRGLAATIEEFLMSAEYILAAGGGTKVILCERGIRTFEPSTRNTLDLSLVPVIRSLSHLPIIIDPSHGTGNRNYVSAMALAAVAVGADGLMIEVHQDPPSAFSDGAQSLYPQQFAKLMRDAAAIAPVVGRQLPLRSVRTAAHAGLAPDAPPGTVAYQGEAGAFSEKAIGHYFGAAVKPIPTATFHETFAKLGRGEVAYAVLPFENSLVGSIHQNYDLLLEHSDLHIVGEVKLRIVHNLIANPGVKMEQIRRIYAHPQAAYQCEEFLRAHPEWEVFNVVDTAGSVRYVKDQGYQDAAAIAGAQAAEILDMEVLREGIETHPRNFTRFLVLSRTAPTLGEGADRADKASIVFETDHTPGALHRILGVFAEHQLNLLKLESRPIPGEPWQYLFYADIQLPERDGFSLDPLLDQIAQSCRQCRCLGLYRACA